MSLSSETLALAKSGDASSVNVVLGVATQIAKVVCQRYAANRSDIDDLAQTVAIKIYKHLATCQASNESQFAAFVTTVSRTTCYDFYRTSGKHEANYLGEYDVALESKEFAAIDAGEILSRAATECGLEEIAELAMAGCSFSEIGKRLGLTKRRVQYFFNQYRDSVQSIMEPAMV